MRRHNKAVELCFHHLRQGVPVGLQRQERKGQSSTVFLPEFTIFSGEKMFVLYEALGDDRLGDPAGHAAKGADADHTAVSYTHLTLPTTPYV